MIPQCIIQNLIPHSKTGIAKGATRFKVQHCYYHIFCWHAAAIQFKSIHRLIDHQIESFIYYSTQFIGVKG